MHILHPKIDLPALTEKTLDVQEWFTRYEKTAKMSGWLKPEPLGGGGGNPTPDPKAEFLSLYLAGDVIVSYNQLPNEVKEDYELVKLAICKRYGLKSRDAYRRFMTARYAPGSALDGFVDELRRLCDCITSMPTSAKETLVLNQFFMSIPEDAGERLAMMCEKDGKMVLEEVLEKARSMTTFRQGPPVITQPPVSAAMDFIPRKAGANDRCFNCNNLGHFSRDCRKPRRNEKEKNGKPSKSSKNSGRGSGRTDPGDQ